MTFRVVQAWGRNATTQSTLISTHPTADDAFAEIDRPRTTMRHVLKRIGELTTPNPILIHGKRVEAMFAFVAASLGKCALIREEDVGDIYATAAVQPPDYRVVLQDGAELLIEVKNCHEIKKPLRLKSDYVERLANYGRTFNRPVKLAVYWSRWRVWTLVPLEGLTVSGRVQG